MQITQCDPSPALGQRGFRVPEEGPREMASRSLGALGRGPPGWEMVLERCGDVPGLLLFPAR